MALAHPTTRRGWILTAGIVVSLAYVFSFGPAVWMTARTTANPDWIARLHLPLLRLYFLLPASVRGPVRWYAKVGLPVHVDGDHVLHDLWLRSYLRHMAYPVGDVAFRVDNGIRRFDAQPIIDYIEANIESKTWDRLGGPALMRADPTHGWLIVSQTPEGHVGVWTHLQQLRQKQQCLSSERKAELRAVYRSLNKDAGILPADEIRDSALVIEAGRTIGVDEHVFRTVDELLEYLDQQPRELLTGGIVVRRSGWNRPPHDLMERLTTYCASRDVDLISHAWDQIADTYHWLVRASDSAYRD